MQDKKRTVLVIESSKYNWPKVYIRDDVSQQNSSIKNHECSSKGMFNVLHHSHAVANKKLLIQ